MNFGKLYSLFISKHKFNTRNHQVHTGYNKIINYKLNNEVRCERVRFTFERAENPNLKCCKRGFHTTRTNRALPPIIWVVIRSVLKIFAILTGRGLRLWWARLSANEKQQIVYRIQKQRPKIFLATAVSGGLVCVYYVSHLVEDPITKRKKFLLFSEKQIVQIANIECDFILKSFRKKILQSGHYYEAVLKVSQRILQANKSYPGTRRKWEVFIINMDGSRNAFVLPSGHIFLFTGMFNIISNDDQLAIILSHEIAHALLNHSAEVISKTHLVELMLLLPIVVVWTLLPDFIALSSHFLIEMISSLLFRLPMSRRLEIEADSVGLLMAARACYDPRQANVLWKKMEDLGEREQLEWLSTHPRYKTRNEILKRRMPEAMDIHTRYCSTSDMDPRSPRY